MKFLRIVVAVIAVAAMCVAFAGCAGSVYSEGEQFKFGDDTYALQKVERLEDEDTGSTDRYAVDVLQVSSKAPVVVTGLADGSMSTRSAINMTLNDGESSYTTAMITFKVTGEAEGYGSKMIFYFDLPAGVDCPTSATLKGSDEEETVELDLSGVVPAKE